MRVTVRVWARGARIVVHLLVGLLAATAVRLTPGGRLDPDPIARRWSAQLLRILNVQVSVCGEPPGSGHVTVANHVSWLDITLLSACENTRFIAKSEIRDWPVAGWLANAAGTFYIRRGKGGARPLVDRLVPHLSAGGSVVLFPEGTTTDGSDVLPFHARLFSAPINADAWVQPVALRYGTGGDGTPVAPFVGDDDLVSHILRLLREQELSVEVIYCAPIRARGLDRGTLASNAEAAVRDALSLQPGPAASRAPSALAA